MCIALALATVSCGYRSEHGEHVGSGRTVHGRSQQSDLPAGVADLVRSTAERNGAVAPDSVLWVRTTRLRALEAAGERPSKDEEDRPAIVVELRGRFVAVDAHPPLGDDGAKPTAPRGTVIDLVVDPVTNTTTDFYLRDDGLPLASLGDVERSPMG